MNTGENILPRQGSGTDDNAETSAMDAIKMFWVQEFNKYTLSYWKGLEPPA